MKVQIVEVGLRDGLQNEETIIPTNMKTKILKELVDAGIKNIEVTSFVHPKWVPQLADAEEVIKDLPDQHDVKYSALVPNMKGMIRAAKSSVQEIAVFLSATNAHNIKNINKNTQDALKTLEPVIQFALSEGKRVRGYVSTVFGCPYEGSVKIQDVAKICEALLQMNVHEISLGDTIGVATPKQVKETLRELRKVLPLSITAGHFHDTRGTGLVNAYVALECGITTLDTSFGGMGGCPYAPGASGNLATEDLVYLLEGMGVKTGIDLEKLCQVSKMVGEYLNRNLPSKVLHSIGCVK